MASENGLLDLTFLVSGNDLSAAADQFIFVKFGDTTPQVAQAHAADHILGISQSTAKTTEGLAVRLVGVSKLRLGGTVKAGNSIKAHSDGTGILNVLTKPYGAQAFEDGVSGDVITVLLEQTQGAS